MSRRQRRPPAGAAGGALVFRARLRLMFVVELAGMRIVVESGGPVERVCDNASIRRTCPLIR